MINMCMVWRREDPKQPAIEAVIEGVQHYRAKEGRFPNFLNVPIGFLTEAEIEQLREKWTVATNAPKYFKNDIWLGVMSPADAIIQTPQPVGVFQQLEGSNS
jgi:hypothetical protein